jgi:hypothetical protein
MNKRIQAAALATLLAWTQTTTLAQPIEALQGWEVGSGILGSKLQRGPVVVYNMNSSPRLYSTLTCGPLGPGSDPHCYGGPPFELPAGALCALDTAVYPGEIWIGNRVYIDNINYVEDRTSGPVGAFNANWMTANNNLDSCANESMHNCSGGRWGSWMIGMMASRSVGATPSGHDPVTMDAGVEYWVNNEWGSGHAIYYTNDWVDTPIALIMTNGSTDGDFFDIRDHGGHGLPTQEQVFDAPLCARYIGARDATR